jgi:hypothetical protein
MHNYFEKILFEYGLIRADALQFSIEDGCCLIHQHSCFPPDLIKTSQLELGEKHLFRKCYSQPFYYAVSPLFALSVPKEKAFLFTNQGDIVAAKLETKSGESLLALGFNPFEEMLLRRQGDKHQVQKIPPKKRECWGFPGERPMYLFDHMLDPKRPFEPWADNLGFLLAEECAKLTGLPLLDVLPFKARCILALTGDDDQAYLETYAEQQRILGNVPITYFLHHMTKHTPESIRAMPGHVTWGLHPDALDNPDEYDALCRAQHEKINALVGKKIRLVRNHGFLNRGYWGHSSTWEECGLTLDANTPGMDGTCRNSSFLPVRLHGIHNYHTPHYGLLTAIGDGMIFVKGITQAQAVYRFHRIVRQIERGHPGVLCCNMHPQNIGRTRWMHRYLRYLARRPGWRALSLETLLDWLLFREQLRWNATQQCFEHPQPEPTVFKEVYGRIWAQSRWKQQKYAVQEIAC